MSNQPSGIQLNAKQSFWYFLYQIMPLKVEVDGEPVQARWGQQFYSLAPGQHQISVSWKMYWLIPVNRGMLDVMVNPGQVVQARYKVRWLWIMKGKLYIEQSGAPAQVAA